jgi:hypothetical protein
MKKKLILVEGLPGSGKTTISKLVQKILLEMNIESQLFLEGDVNHPADFESVACIGEAEYDVIKNQFLDHSLIRKEGNSYLIPYRKLLGLPNELLELLSKDDIYELPFEKNQEMIVNNWGKFAETAIGNFIFECCFIQNPVTVGMIKYGVSDVLIIEYVNSLAEKVSALNPILIYINQDNLGAAFAKAVEDRPKDWSQGFIEYYTTQGYGKAHALEGFEGTVEVLKARKELEKKVICQLSVPKIIINNSNYDLNEVTSFLKNELNNF